MNRFTFIYKIYRMILITGGFVMKKAMLRILAAACGLVVMTLHTVPVSAAAKGLGPWGDIDGYYTWQINGKGWTVYSQNGYSWVYDDYGNRTYLDAYGNKLDGVTAAAAKTITQYSLTYYSTVSGITVYKNPDGKLYTVGSDGILHLYGNDTPAPAPAPAPAPSVNNYTFYYSYTSPNGYNVYTDGYGNTWWFAQGGIPNRWTYGYQTGSYWKNDVPNYTFYYSYRSNDGYYIYRDDYNNTWWFGSDGTPHLVRQGSGGGQGGDKPAPAPAPSSDVDFNHKNVMEADGVRSTVYVGQYWVAPKTVSWAPSGMRLIGWDYAENTGYVRWKPGAFIKNTGTDLYLYPVYGK